MDIKIGVTDSSRELVVSSTQEPEEIEAKVAAAVAGETTTLTLVDDKGRRVIVPAARITYVEIAPSDTRRVGFGLGH